MPLENEGHVRCKRWLADELVVIGMGANPEPNKVLTGLDCERTMVKADARRPEATNLLEMQGGVPRILLEVFV
jgi:hypothetical protein